jgi:photosystem II stability/assembly factor-like uncharacterized protein
MRLPEPCDRRLAAPAAALVAAVAATWGAAAPAADEASAEIAPLAIDSLLLDGIVVDGRYVVVGERGHILVSTDAGHDWEQASVPTRATLTGVWFSDPELGWAVGHDETILKTTDGGRTWRVVHAAPENLWPLLDVWFRDADHGIAVGAYSKYLVSDDGGETWNATPFAPGKAAPAADDGSSRPDESPAANEADESDEAWYADDELGYDVHLNEIVPAGTHLYLPAEAGQIFRSDDDGATWLELPSPYEGSFYAALPLENDALLIFGLRGHLYRSEDSGADWVEIETGTDAMLTDGTVTADGTVVIVGLAGTILLSHDGGKTFMLDQQPDRKGYARVIASADRLLLLGEGGVHAYVPPRAATGSGESAR